MDLKQNPDLVYDKVALEEMLELRNFYTTFDKPDEAKNDAYNIDGFGSLYEYYQSGNVEIIEVEGTIYDNTNRIYENKIITIADRSKILRIVDNPSWLGKSTKVHVGWRQRPDNLWGMGPLDNLVGLQYRIDHLENVKADLYDLIAHPPLKIKGQVEEFEWGPFAEIFLGEDGEIDTLKVDTVGLTADTQIATLEQRMELMAGAPREAMGVRSPGEKTAFEVQSLDNAASRIFQEKIRQFEVFILEPALNNMLEISRRNLSTSDSIVFDLDSGAKGFREITKQDITAKGQLYAIGSRHWAANNLFIQNMSGIFNSAIGQIIAPHVSSKALTKAVESALGWERYGIFSENVAVMEQMETQQLINSAQEQTDVASITPGIEDNGQPPQ